MTLETPNRLTASFLTSAPSIAACPPEDEPEITIAGRSNAGKSSVLNQLTGNTKLARASKTPGRTRLINYFTTDIGGRLVDLPGYGYADAGHDERRVWQRSVEQYLEGRHALLQILEDRPGDVAGVPGVGEYGIRAPLGPLDKDRHEPVRILPWQGTKEHGIDD